MENVEESEINNIKHQHYILVTIMIYLYNSFVAISSKGIVVVIFILISGAVLFLGNLKNIRVPINIIALFIVFFISSLLSLSVNGDGLYQYLIFWNSLLAAFLICISIPFGTFKKVFVSVMYFLSCFSLVTFVIAIIYPDLLRIIPIFTNSSGLVAYNFIFSVVPIGIDIHRNFGLFWEPGAYQSYLNLALLFVLFSENQASTKKVFIFLLTNITTMSTTAYIVAGLICITYIIRNFRSLFIQEKRYNKTARVIAGFIVVGIVFFILMPSSYRFQIFGKLRILFDDSGTYYSGYSSTTIRLQSLIQPLTAFIHQPIFGLGYERFYLFPEIYGYTMNVCTPANWFALFGFVFGVCMCIGFVSLFFIKKEKWYMNTLLMLTSILIISSEDYHRNALIICFVFYGWNKLSKFRFSKLLIKVEGDPL